MSLRLDWCSYTAAKYAVEHWHYSKTMPVNKTVRLGVWEDDKFIGAVIFSCGSAGVGGIGKSLGMANTQIVELSRVALQGHQSPVTRIVKVALRLLAERNPGLVLVVSYADPEHGHVGAIYQAGNWIYTGRSAKDKAYIDASGRRWHSRSVSESGYKVHCGIRTRCPKPSTMREVDVEPKYRYMMPLTPAARQRIEPLRKPYPKRSECDSSTAAFHAAGGGATPTRTLQENT